MGKKKDNARLKVVPFIENEPIVFQTPEEHYDYLIREYEKLDFPRFCRHLLTSTRSPFKLIGAELPQ